MKIQIHKGTNEIGGTCIEISTNRTKILLDYGTPLNDKTEPAAIKHKIDGIVISHPHKDHFGAIADIDKNIPIYCGELSQKLINSSRLFVPNKDKSGHEELLTNNFQYFEKSKSFNIGDIKITPLLIDHSACEAFVFLIEADNKKIVYSGDFRAHGRKSELFDIILKNQKLKNPDILLLEGTMMQRSNDEFPTEQAVEDRIYQSIKDNDNLSFMISSSQNIDSLVSAYRACKRLNKIFVVDMYTAWALEQVKLVSDSVPNKDWGDVQVITKLVGRQYGVIEKNPEYFGSFLKEIFNKKDIVVEIDDIKNNPQNYFLKVSAWRVQNVINHFDLKTANIIYNQWIGHLEHKYSEDDAVSMYKNLKDNYNWIYAHTSGHADLATLKKFATAINPKTLIPVHTEHKNEYNKHFENVKVLDDGDNIII
ncbi:MAG: hypothetical protein DRQ51_04920 [Gammaproteobacteria bacterium]|nr:MAG: hypothetical protein DRQ51_04920 [Gammaproteobacteria bacterium]